jgi:hypothetical protein
MVPGLIFEPVASRISRNAGHITATFSSIQKGNEKTVVKGYTWEM